MLKPLNVGRPWLDLAFGHWCPNVEVEAHVVGTEGAAMLPAMLKHQGVTIHPDNDPLRNLTEQANHLADLGQMKVWNAIHTGDNA